PRASAVHGDDRLSILQALGRLWCAGVAVDWEAFQAGLERRRVPLPTYPFERRRYWIDPASAPPEPALQNPDPEAWVYLPGWKRSVPLREAAVPAEPDWLVFDDGSELGSAVVSLAASRGARAVRVEAGRAGGRFERIEGGAFRIDPRSPDQHRELWRAL